jgi:hypothetical protein
VPLKYFTQLQAIDIVFIDSNHVVKSGSEVNYIVLEILPIIPKGVLVHFHDIYLPYEMIETYCAISPTQMKLRLSLLFLRAIRATRYFSL